MHKESKNWKLVNDRGLFEFPENEKYLVVSSLNQELIKCEDYSFSLKQVKNERPFKEATKLENRRLVKVLLLDPQWNFTVKIILNKD
jgi:hypothetical protein